MCSKIRCDDTVGNFLGTKQDLVKLLQVSGHKHFELIVIELSRDFVCREGNLMRVANV